MLFAFQFLNTRDERESLKNSKGKKKTLIYLNFMRKDKFDVNVFLSFYNSRKNRSWLRDFFI